MFLESALLNSVGGVKHVFSTRLGGVSGGHHATFNVGKDVGDDAALVQENRRRVALRLALVDRDVQQVVQVHGTTVRRAPDEAGLEGDALFTTEPQVAVGVRTADCAPILLASMDAAGHPEAVAAIHAGWRGAAALIVGETVRIIEELGGKRDKMLLAIGPTISQDAFEVGEEVVEAARASLKGEEPPIVRRSSGKAHLDLRGLLQRQLEQLEIPPTRVELVGGCTYSHAALYFSHRRDRGRTGRHLSAIAFSRG